MTALAMTQCKPGPLLAPCPKQRAAAFSSSTRAQRMRRSGRMVCQAREKVGSLLRDAMTTRSRTPDLGYQSAANYLQGLGINNQSEIAMILDIATNPNSVYGKRNGKQNVNPHARRLTVDEDLKPVVEYLLTLGLDETAVRGIICRHPAVLCYSVEGRLQPFVEFLVGEIGIPQQQVAKALQDRPNMLGMELEGVKRIVGYLAANGKGMEEIGQLLQSSL